jgi:hypothetical protein
MNKRERFFFVTLITRCTLLQEMITCLNKRSCYGKGNEKEGKGAFGVVF